MDAFFLSENTDFFRNKIKQVVNSHTYVTNL